MSKKQSEGNYIGGGKIIMEDNKEDKEFEPKYPAQLYTSRPNPTALLSPLYDSTFKWSIRFHL